MRVLLGFFQGCSIKVVIQSSSSYKGFDTSSIKVSKLTCGNTGSIGVLYRFYKDAL